MGTRADFYVGRGKDAEWLGSIAWDGYPAGLTPDSHNATKKEDIPNTPVLIAKTEGEYRFAVNTLLASREDATRPEQGWPWPWNNSATTDYAYAFDDGQVWGTQFGKGWWPAIAEPKEHDDEANVEFPDMSSRKATTLGPRSGLLVFQGKK